MGVNEVLIKAIFDISDLSKELKNINAKEIAKQFGITKEIADSFNTGFQSINNDFQRLTNKFNKAKAVNFFGDAKELQVVQRKLEDINKLQTKQLATVQKTQLAYEKQTIATQSRLSETALKTFREGGAGALRAGILTGQAGFEGIVGTAEKLSQLEKASSKLKTVENRLLGVGNSITEMKNKVEVAQKPFVNFMNNLGVKGNSLIGIFGTLAGKVTTWLIATKAVFLIIQGFREFIVEMKTLQDAFVGLTKVLNGSDTQIKSNIKTAREFAREMNVLTGALQTDTVKALTDSKRAGFDFADAMSITRTALLAVNVSEMSVEESTRTLVATIRQFNLQASDSLSILNQWNELSNKTGTDTSNLAEAVVRSGAAFKSVGGSLTQLNAIAAQIIESTGEGGDVIGTMLKTLSARYADINKNNSLRDLLKTDGINIEIYNEADETFNSIFTTLSRLSEQFKTLAGSQQSAITKTAVGIRQYTKFLPIMDNFDKIMRAYAIAINSGNSAMDENRKRVNTLDFAIRELKGSFNELAQSKGALFLLGLMTTTLKVLSTLIDTVTNKWVLMSIAIGATVISIKELIPVIKLINGLNIALGIGMLKASFSVGVFSKAITSMLTIISAHPLIAWSIAIIGVGGAIIGYTKKLARAKSELTDFTVAAVNSRIELQGNVKELLKSFETSKDVETRKEIRNMFKNMNSDILPILDSADSFAEKLRKITTIVNDLNSLNSIILKMSNSMAVSKNTSIELAKELSKLGVDLRKDLGKLNDEELLKLKVQLNTLIDVPKFRDSIKALQSVINKYYNDIVERNHTANEEQFKSNVQKALQYFERRTEIAKKAYEKEKIFYEGLFDSISVGLDLGNIDKTFGERIQGVLNGIGSTIVNQYVSALKDGIVESFTGKPVDYFKYWNDIIKQTNEDGKRQLVVAYKFGYETAKLAAQYIKAYNEESYKNGAEVIKEASKEQKTDITTAMTEGTDKLNLFNKAFKETAGGLKIIYKSFLDSLSNIKKFFFGDKDDKNNTIKIGDKTYTFKEYGNMINKTLGIEDATKIPTINIAKGNEVIDTFNIKKTAEDIKNTLGIKDSTTTITESKLKVSDLNTAIKENTKDTKQTNKELEKLTKALDNAQREALDVALSKPLEDKLDPTVKDELKNLFLKDIEDFKSGISKFFTNIFKDNPQLTGLISKAGYGAGVGSIGATLAGKETGLGSSLGGITGNLIGSAFGPVGALIGGALGGALFGDQKKKEKKSDQLNTQNAKNTNESLKQLKIMNRNITKMLDKMDSYAMPESYYFGVSNARGLQ